MTKITMNKTWTIELSDKEFRFVTESVRKNAIDKDEKALFRSFSSQIDNNGNDPDDDFSIGDHVVLLFDISHINLCNGDIFEVIDVDNGYLEVIKDGEKESHWLKSDLFSYNDVCISVEEIQDQIKDVLVNNSLSHDDFQNLLNVFSKVKS